MLKGIDTSAIKYFNFLSASEILEGGSGTAYDLSKFTHGTLLFSCGSTAAGVLTGDVLRSSASNGTFHNFGASVSAAIANSLHVRSFTLGSSDVWYKLYHTQTGNGSPAVAAVLVAQGARVAPVNQATLVTSYSVINEA